METLAPRNEQELEETIRMALANATPVEIVGGGSRWKLGRPPTGALRVSTDNLTGVTLYEPSELVLTALAGTTLAEITALLDENNQELAFEPQDHSAIFGLTDAAATIGGMIAVNACGPRRIKVGSARDHLLGFRSVTGRGEIIQSGGRVMKNVTGYDLSKLMTGAFGTLGVLSEVTVKILPKAEMETTLLVVGLQDPAAIEVMTETTNLPFEVSSFAHLPSNVSGVFGKELEGIAGQPVTGLRLEGPSISVADRTTALMTELGGSARQFETLVASRSKDFWRKIRDVTPLSNSRTQIWRISTAPSLGAAVVTNIKAEDVPVTGHYFDWAGGLIWLAVEPEDDANAETIRSVVEKYGGHATLIRANDDVRATVPVFHPQPKALAELTARVRKNFDPELILNRGRMREDL